MNILRKDLKMPPAGLIFDMDGTLLDTEPLYTIATQQLLDPYNVEFTLELKRKCMGGDSKRSAAIVIAAFNLPLTPEAYLSQREVFLRALFKDAKEITGAGNFIQTLSKTDLPVGLATSSHRHLYELKMRDKAWGQLFNEVVCGDDSELKQGKPHPDIFILCAQRLGVKPDACIAFEDSPSGISAALAAGMQVIAINSPYVEANGFAGAALVIDSYEELEELAQGWI